MAVITDSVSDTLKTDGAPAATPPVPPLPTFVNRLYASINDAMAHGVTVSDVVFYLGKATQELYAAASQVPPPQSKN